LSSAPGARNCPAVDPLVTPYVDGELPPADAAAVDQHAAVCPPCRARIDAERAVRDLMRTRQTELQVPAPAELRARCERLAAPEAHSAAVTRVPRATRLAPFALAATLVLIVAGAFVYRMTQISTRVMAAELTADHLKCAVVNSVAGTAQSAAVVKGSMSSRFGWHAELPEHPEEAGLELIGARPCLYGEGSVAHIMYKHEGSTVSVFMLPRSHRAEEHLGLLGHHAAIWSTGDRTFVVIARKSREELERIATFIHDRLR
jgi:anti-sigma factor (TIGR02949 family)